MLKNIQIKSVMFFAILGIIFITLLGMFFVNRLENVVQALDERKIEDEQIISNVNEQLRETKIVISTSLGIFAVISIVIGIVESFVIVSPITKLLKSAEDITTGKDAKTVKFGKKKNDINDLIDAFSLMNNELKENLNEVSRQKKQIETILLNMTDGIIASDIDGNVIYLNPVAKTYLNIKDENNINNIFDKYNVDINLEKIIYLENWTSSEKKKNI